MSCQSPICREKSTLWIGYKLTFNHQTSKDFGWKKKWRKQLPKIWIFLLKTEPYWSIRIKDKNKIRNSVKFIIKIIIRFECLIPLFFDMREKFYGFIWHIWTHILKYANYKSAQLSLTTFCLSTVVKNLSKSLILLLCERSEQSLFLAKKSQMRHFWVIFKQCT